MAEKEYIERGALLAEDFTDRFVDVYDVAIFESIIESAPAADVVEVCRCKDCKHYKPVTPTCGNCFRTTFIQHPDDFCSRGERKEESDG